MRPSNMRTRITTSKTTATTIRRLRPYLLSGYSSSSSASASATLMTTQTERSINIFSSYTNRSFYSSSSTKGRRSSSTTTTTTTTTTSTTLVSPLKPHDVGGFEGLLSNSTNSTSTIDEKNLDESLGDSPRSEEENVQFWERQCHALFAVLSSKKHIKTDELRRTIETLDPSQYVTWT